jgi:uncharacterized membrane protein
MFRKTTVTIAVALALSSAFITTDAFARGYHGGRGDSGHAGRGHGGGYGNYGGAYGGYYGPAYGFGGCLPVPVPIVGCW